MRIMVLGAGHIGSVIAKDLAENLPSARVLVSDKDQNRAKETSTRIGRKNVSSIQFDAFDRSGLVKALKGSDLVIGALPGKIGYNALEACIDAKVNMVDVSFMPEDPLTLDRKAAKAGVTIIPDCGVAPGLSHVLLMHGISKLDQVQSAEILVGGLPSKPIPPLGYTITWSVESLIDEYTRKARIVKDGKQAEVEPLGDVEEIEFPGVGRLEAFYSDGLRTLLSTITNVGDMAEKTLRYPGHIEKIRLLRDMGFFDDKPIEVEKRHISPKSLTIKLLERKLKKPEIPDILAMLVKVEGTKDRKRTTHTFRVLDHYDSHAKISAMARTTAYTASCVAQLVAKKTVKAKGIVPPEKLGADEAVFKKLMVLLKNHKIHVKEEKKSLL